MQVHCARQVCYQPVSSLGRLDAFACSDLPGELFPAARRRAGELCFVLARREVGKAASTAAATAADFWAVHCAQQSRVAAALALGLTEWSRSALAKPFGARKSSKQVGASGELKASQRVRLALRRRTATPN